MYRPTRPDRVEQVQCKQFEVAFYAMFDLIFNKLQETQLSHWNVLAGTFCALAHNMLDRATPFPTVYHTCKAMHPLKRYSV